ncbi:unnamed protein product, partial [Mesorhabditis belari]|uniref:Uncharacterized protein n=1 Tax=Mesorhabditis belari TaxID=2138241 RepID=A0AAF3FCS7_9BILA
MPFFDMHAYKHVNLDVSPSENPQGQDLPLNDVSTLRFFFNLGVQQSRVVLLNQHLNQHPSARSQGSNFATPAAPMVGLGGKSPPNQPAAVQPPQPINLPGIQLKQPQVQSPNVAKPGSLEALLLQQALAAAQNNPSNKKSWDAEEAPNR